MKKVCLLFLLLAFLGCDIDNTPRYLESLSPPSWIIGTWTTEPRTWSGVTYIDLTWEFTENNATYFRHGETKVDFRNKDILSEDTILTTYQITTDSELEKNTYTGNYESSMFYHFYYFEIISETSMEYNHRYTDFIEPYTLYKQ